jgi:DNA-binding winged helix-turn-helix (wHTH) protein
VANLTSTYVVAGGNAKGNVRCTSFNVSGRMPALYHACRSSFWSDAPAHKTKSPKNYAERSANPTSETTVEGKEIAMRTLTRRDTPRRIDSAYIGTGAMPSEPRSASLRLLDSSNRHGEHRSVVRSTRTPPRLQNETTELLTDIDGLPILVRFLVKDIPAEMQADFVSRGTDIHSLLSNTLERMVDRMRGSSLRSDALPRQPLDINSIIASGEPLVRLPVPPNETELRVGPLVLDLLDRTAKRGDRHIDLRPREFRLLKYMMQRSDKLLSRESLLREVWHYKFVPETNLVDVHMGRLRRKVDGPNEAPMIRNVRGVGFVLTATPLSQGSPSRPAEPARNPALVDKSQRLVDGTVQ